MRETRAFLLFESIAFALASLVHRGLLVDGFDDPGASTAEGIIAIVLVAGLVVSFVAPARTRVIGLVAQAFALLGTTIGLFLLIVVGPQTLPDLVFHIGIYVVLIIGLIVAARSGRNDRNTGGT